MCRSYKKTRQSDKGKRQSEWSASREYLPDTRFLRVVCLCVTEKPRRSLTMRRHPRSRQRKRQRLWCEQTFISRHSIYSSASYWVHYTLLLCVFEYKERLLVCLWWFDVWCFMIILMFVLLKKLITRFTIEKIFPPGHTCKAHSLLAQHHEKLNKNRVIISSSYYYVLYCTE